MANKFPEGRDHGFLQRRIRRTKKELQKEKYDKAVASGEIVVEKKPELVLTADLIFGFTNALLVKNYDNPVRTPDFHMELWNLMCSNHPLVAVAAPRGHAKSTAVTHAFTLANICFQQAFHIVILSDTEGQAVNFLGDIKHELLENEALQELFGIVPKLDKERETEIIVRFHDGKKCRIVAKGSEQKLRGLKWRGKRPDLIVCDDLENDEIVMNDERRKKFKNWFLSALLPAGSKNCRVRVVGTILHLDSLLENLMPPMGQENTVSVGLRDFSTEERTWLSVRYKAHTPDFSKILWKEQFSKERLLEIQQNYIEQGFPEGYSQEYLNYPIDDKNAYFKKEDLLEIDIPKDTPEEFYIGVDMAISERDQAAFTVFVVASMAADNKLRVRHVERFRGDSLDILETIFTLNQRYHPEAFFIEQENIARTLGPVLTKEMEVRGIYPRIETMTASQDKIKRARALQARMRAGMVEFDKDKDWYRELQQELITFPRGKFKDQVDALAWIALGLDKMYEAPTAQELIDNTYDEDFENTSDFLKGSSYITGY